MASSNEESHSDKKKRMRATTKAPSKTKWEDIQELGIVPSGYEMSQFRENVIVARKPAPLTESCGSPEINHFQHCHSVLVKKLCIDNEGFPSAKYTLLFSHLTNHLGDDYNVKVYPVIKKERDQRRNKRSDCTIMKLKNRRTVLVCELTFGLTKEILVLEDEFSQLLQEVRYAYETDAKSSAHRYKYMLAILGDHIIWHVLLLQCSCKPYIIVDSYMIHVEDIELGVLCHFLQGCIQSVIRDLK